MNDLTNFIPEPLAKAVLDQYRLHLNGVHGLRHWIRVWIIGEELCSSTGANVEVVRLFAFLHDVCRKDEDIDLLHGVRAAKLIKNVLQPEILHLPKAEAKLLEYAVQRHTFGSLRANPTVMTCWDADRLDLGRVGILPLPDRLCTAAARDPAMIRKAYAASLEG